MKTLHRVTFILLVVGGLNWGLYAFNYNLVDTIFGFGSIGAFVVYLLVGISAIIEIFTHKSYCKHCEQKPQPQQM